MRQSGRIAYALSHRSSPASWPNAIAAAFSIDIPEAAICVNVPQEALSGAGSSLQAEAAYRSDGLAAECVSRQREGWHFGRSALSRLAGRFIFYWADLPKEWNRQRASALHACWRSRPSLKTRLAGEPVAPDSSPVGKAASPQGRPFHYLGQIDHDQRSRSRSLVR